MRSRKRHVEEEMNHEAWVIPYADLLTLLLAMFLALWATGIGLALYTQLDFKAALGEHTLRGDVGLRSVETTIEATGLLPTAANPLNSVTVEHDYTDLLPSLNVATSRATSSRRRRTSRTPTRGCPIPTWRRGRLPTRSIA